MVISGSHAEIEAIGARLNGFDRLWVLGGLVNDGPNPAHVIEFVREKASMARLHEPACGEEWSC